MKYQLVIFDWDGTLMDSVPKITSSIQKAAQLAQLPELSYEQASEIIGLSLTEAVTTLFPNAPDDKLQMVCEYYRQQFTQDNPTPMTWFTGAQTLLEKLKQQGYQLAVATGKSRPGLDKLLESHGLIDCFAATRTASEAQSKPSPEMLLQILQELHTKPEDAVMIGDTEFDLLMANNAGVAAIGVSYGAHDRARLAACAPLTIVDSLDELAAWI